MEALPFAAVKRGRSGEAAEVTPVKRQRSAAAEAAPAEAHTPESVAPASAVSFGRQGVQVDPVIKKLYSVVNERTFLDWGLTSDWEVSGPRSRRSSLASAGASATPPPRAAAPAAVDEEETAGNSASEGYGEMTEGSVQRLLNHLADLRAHAFDAGGEAALTAARLGAGHDLGAASRLVDVGSGYGKVVLHAALARAAGRCEGVEYVGSRAAKAAQLLADLRSGTLAARLGCEPAALRASLAGCALRCGDATAAGERLDYSHVYMYDKVFAEATLRALAPKLGAAKRLRVLASYRPLAAWRALGLKGSWGAAGSLKMRTTGGQNFTCFLLARLSSA